MSHCRPYMGFGDLDDMDDEFVDEDDADPDLL